MSRNKRSKQHTPELSTEDSLVTVPDSDPAAKRTSRLGNLMQYFRQRLWLVAAILLVSVGGFGAAMKYLQEDAARQNALKVTDRSALSSVNPFVVSPTPTPTPQHSKDYI